MSYLTMYILVVPDVRYRVPCIDPDSPWQKAPLHSTGDASRKGRRWTIPQWGRIWSICSLVTPCQPGVSPVSVRRGVSPRAVNAIRARLVDFEKIVRKHVYHLDFAGSFSLKKVVPALVPENGGAKTDHSAAV